VVLMDRIDYIDESTRQLSDENFYIETKEDLTQKHCEDIQKLLDLMLYRLEITPHIHEYLSPVESKTANFYFLPKIHKPTITGRPIISGNGSPTEAISAFVDEHIKRYVPLLPSYIRDTTDFIRKIEKIVLPELVSTTHVETSSDKLAFLESIFSCYALLYYTVLL
jgi:hypothetical protein